LAALDLLAQLGGDDLVRSARSARCNNRLGHDPGHSHRRALIGSDDPVRVHAKRRCAAATLAKTASDGANVDTSSDEFSG
jgi:hypothetical protein